MKILFVTNVFPNPFHPTKGVFNLELARGLAGRHEVQVITPISWTDEFKAKIKTRISIGLQRYEIHGGLKIHYPRYFYPPKILRNHYGWFFWQSVRPLVVRLLESFVPDAVLGYWAHPDGETAVRIARSVGVPAVVMVGGSDVFLLTKERKRRRRILKVLQDADSVVTTSQDLKNHLLAFGLRPEKVHVIYRGVDSKLFCPGGQLAARQRLGIAPEIHMVLWVGRMVPVKGLDVLLEACTLLRVRNLKFRLYLVGAGPLRRILESECRSRGLSEMVFFVGSVDYQELPDWYRAADLTVLSSRSEGVPNVLRESLACGTPFVASRVGGIPEIAQDPANQLIPPDDPQALANAIAQELMEVHRIRPQFRPMGWNASADSLASVLRSLVESQVHRASSARTHLAFRGRSLATFSL